MNNILAAKILMSHLPEIKDGVYKIYLDNKFIGLGIVSENKLKRDLLLLN